MKKNYSIVLLFEKEFEEYINEMWHKCKDKNLSTVMTDIKGDSLPHIALSVYENVEENEIISLFERYKNVKEEKAEFETSSVCMFKATNVTYVNVNVNRDMLNYFENVYHFFTSISDKCAPFYLPPVIIPHISIGRNETLEDAKKCWSYVMDIFEPKKFLINRIGLFELSFKDNAVVECKKIDEKNLI